MNSITDQLKRGTYGELLVQLRMLEYDVQAAPPLKDSGNDLIAIRGPVFAAIQVKTAATPRFDLRGLVDRDFHIAALVFLVSSADGRSVKLDESPIFLLTKSEVKSSYRVAELECYKMSQHRVDDIFREIAESR